MTERVRDGESKSSLFLEQLISPNSLDVTLVYPP